MNGGTIRYCVALSLWLCASMAPASAIEHDVPPVLNHEAVLQQEREADAVLRARCAIVVKQVERWISLLRMQDWNITLLCTSRPPWEEEGKPEAGLRGSSMTFVDRKAMYIWIDTNDKDTNRVSVHELMHGLVNYANAIKSPIINENIVDVLAELYGDYDAALKKALKGDKNMLSALGRE